MGAGQQLIEQLDPLRDTKTLIVGIGNPLRGDDGAGPLICEQLRHAAASADLIDAGTVPENYIEPIIKKAPHNLVVIDAVNFGAAPGAARIFKPEQLSSISFSTHSPSPRLFIEMITEAIKADVYFIGIQPAHTRLGQPLSGQVSDTVELLTEVLMEIFPSAK
ncbi:MAG: hydrogenase 3 maturation endopeptidase HyCI [Planctomycetota bacterium]|jgi:hydrogenase 3 maturation protease